MKKSVKIIISVLAIVLICAISFDVLLVNNSKQETPVNTTQNIENQVTESEEKTYSNPVEAQARKMVENMTLYEKVGQMLLYYIPKEEPLKKMARWQFGGYILFSRNFQNSTPANTRSEIEEYQKASKIPAFMAVDEEGGGVNRVSQFSQYRSEPFHAGITNYQKGGWQAVEADAKDKSKFMLMKKDAIFVNVGRGSLVVQEDLVDVLKSGHLKGAVLDVTDPEPLPPDSSLWGIENVIITPHISGKSFGHSKEISDSIYHICAENLKNYSAGMPIKNLIDFSKFKK